MNRYDRLIEDAAKQLDISKGLTENVETWEARVIYSILGRMALASLWDKEEDNQPISITHFKHRIEDLLNAYRELYPEIKAVFSADPQELTEEIYSIYSGTGCLYHSSNRISPVQESKAAVDNILFIRGSQLNRPIFMSGLGTYIKNKESKASFSEIFSMFQLQQQTLDAYWNCLIAKAQWFGLNVQTRTEYLRIAAPFSRGYWKNIPDTDGKVSLIRLGELGMQIYYLYRYDDGKCMGSALPEWTVTNYEYRRISNCLLHVIGRLPDISFHEDGAIIHVKLNYLLPPAELEFLKLYSWPKSFHTFPHDFNRVMEHSVFEAYKSVLEQIGYRFVKG